MLMGCRRIPKPRIVGDIHQKPCAPSDEAAHEIRKEVFKTNQDRKGDGGLVKDNGLLSRQEGANAGVIGPQKRKDGSERKILPEGDKMNLVIAADHLSFRREQHGTVCRPPFPSPTLHPAVPIRSDDRLPTGRSP